MAMKPNSPYKEAWEKEKDDDLGSEATLESQPLLTPRGSVPANNDEFTSPYFTIENKPKLEEHDIIDTMLYGTRKLTSLEVFTINMLTVWSNSRLWMLMAKLFMISMVVCCVTIAVVPNPVTLKVGRFTDISKFLNVVVGLLLGFYLSSSMNRWYKCVDGYLSLLDAIRNMQMQLVALGVPEPQTIMCLRYGLSSAWLLYGQLRCEVKRGREEVEARENMWLAMAEKKAKIDPTGKTMMLEGWEIEALRTTRDPPGIMWMWVAALIGRLAQDGWIPPMPSPTYGRVMKLCQSAHAGIREVRATISVQSPFPYTHALATLVQVNNLLNAVCFGVVSGLAISDMLALNHVRIPGHPVVDVRVKEQQQDLQSMAVTFMYCSLGPLLYQALLLISFQLAQPFDHEEAWIPMDRLAEQLEVDMCNGRDLTEVMAFEKPFFKQQPTPENIQALRSKAAKRLSVAM